MYSTDKKMDSRKSDFKKGIKSEEKTRQRQEEQISIRKAKRDEKLDTKRRQVDNVSANDDKISMSREQKRKERQSERSGDFKKGITAEDAFAKRAKDQIQRIKANREYRFNKLRGKVDKPQMHEQKDIQEWRKMLYLKGDTEDSVSQVFKAIKHFRSLTSGGSELGSMIDDIIDLGIGPRIVELANASKFPKIQFEATWLLTNITSGTSSQTVYVANLPHAIEVLVKLLNTSDDEGLRENVIWTLANMAGDSVKYRDNVLSINNVIPLFLKNLNTSTNVTNTKTTIWAFSNLLRGKPSPNISNEHAIGIINSLAKVLGGLDPRSEGNKELISDICWACSYISDIHEEKGNEFVPVYGDDLIKSGIVDKMIELLYSQEFIIKQPSLRTLGNLVAGTAEQTSYILNHGFLVKCASLLNVKKTDIRKETVWIISNIAVGSKAQKNLLFESGLVEKVVKLFDEDSLSVKNECMWVIKHLCDDEENIDKIVNYNVFSALCNIFDSNNTDILLRALNLLNIILKHGKNNGHMYAYLAEDAQCVEKVEVLQEHKNIEVYESAVDIIEKFFNDESIYSPSGERMDNNLYSPNMKPRQFNF